MSTDAPRTERSGAPEHHSPQRRMGAFYTPDTAAMLMARWALRSACDVALEPSAGDGAFLRALVRTGAERGWDDLDLHAVEIDPAPARALVSEELVDGHRVTCDDFLAVEPFDVDAVVGNPPFVRLRHLGDPGRATALRAAESVLGSGMDPSGSTWMPFVLHSLRFLRRGGRLALVLPYEATYVRYALPLWTHLGASFGSIRVLRTFDRLFADILQDVVIVLADDFGATTDEVFYDVADSVEQLDTSAARRTRVPLARVVAGERPFTEALLPPEASSLLDALGNRLVPADERCRFHIGYVTGDKRFFHPPAAIAERFSLPAGSLHAAVSSGRALRGQGLFTAGLEPTRLDTLFRPGPDAPLTEGEARYVAHGEEQGVHRRYKCRVRRPWYVVPPVRVPDLVMTVFSADPVVMVNDARITVSNSLLGGYLQGTDPGELVTAWYSSLTQLEAELRIHALGGGVMVAVPREVGRIRIPGPAVDLSAVRSAALARVHRHLAEGRTDDAYRVGDELVLRRRLGLTSTDVATIQDGLATLRRWRQDR